MNKIFTFSVFIVIFFFLGFLTCFLFLDDYKIKYETCEEAYFHLSRTPHCDIIPEDCYCGIMKECISQCSINFTLGFEIELENYSLDYAYDEKGETKC